MDVVAALYFLQTRCVQPVDLPGAHWKKRNILGHIKYTNKIADEQKKLGRSQVKVVANPYAAYTHEQTFRQKRPDGTNQLDIPNVCGLQTFVRKADEP